MTVLFKVLLAAVAIGIAVWIEARARRRPILPPWCYGSAPSPQERAENDCDSCPWADRCLPQVLVPVVNWRSMHSAPKDREFWALSDDTRGNDLPPFVSKCRWHPGAGFCTDELREPIMWRPL